MEAIPLHKQLAMGKPYPKSIPGEGKKVVDTAKRTSGPAPTQGTKKSVK